jgi:hypothetical protein
MLRPISALARELTIPAIPHMAGSLTPPSRDVTLAIGRRFV